MQGRQRALKASQQIRNCETGEFLDSLPIKSSSVSRVMVNIKVHSDASADGSDRCNLRCYALESTVAGRRVGASTLLVLQGSVIRVRVPLVGGCNLSAACLPCYLVVLY